VRQAMSLALDRQAMNDVIFQGKGELEGPMMAQLVAWRLPIDQLGAGAKYFTRDLAAAKQLLAEAGYPNGFAMDFWSSQGLGSTYVSFFEMMKAQWADVGIDATLRWQDFNTFVSTTNTGKYEDAGGGGWSPVTDPDEHLSKAFYSKGGRNTSHINDPTLDKMLLAQETTSDPAERKKQIDEIQRYLAEQQYYMTLVAERSIFASHAYVKGYWPHILIGQSEVASVWLDR
jgi:peptide/nickel transport system substrate-binding protein